MNIEEEKFELILSSMRILNLLEVFKKNKTYSMTFDKVILFDFYMRFPQTMIQEKKDKNEFDFEELYSFYHSQPDRDNYRLVTNYLISKKLITKDIIGSSFLYKISNTGIQMVNEIDNPFAHRMKENALLIKKDISKLSESKLREVINSKSLNNIQLI
jgi:hypothetical protein